MNRRFFAALLIGWVVSAVPLPASEPAAWLSKVEGFYASQRNPTPFGQIGFAMDMIKQPDGSMHGRSWSDSQTYFDFKFYLNDRGEMQFQETGSLPGGFVQSYVLDLVSAEGDTLNFETKKHPGLLAAKVTATGENLRVEAVLRGQPHVDLNLTRVRNEKAIAGYRAANARNKDLPAGSALKAAFSQSASAEIDASLPKPAQARQHLAEHKKLLVQLGTAAPSDVTGLAFKAKGHLDRALELDPTFDEARFQLAMWNLNAPELAGGSKAKAQEILQQLEKQNSPHAEALRKALAGASR